MMDNDGGTHSPVRARMTQQFVDLVSHGVRAFQRITNHLSQQAGVSFRVNETHISHRVSHQGVAFEGKTRRSELDGVAAARNSTVETRRPELGGVAAARYSTVKTRGPELGGVAVERYSTVSESLSIQFIIHGFIYLKRINPK